MSHVCGIVLAAGGSSRLGRPKQLLPLGGITLLGWVVARVEASSLDQVVLVLGAAADDVRQALRTTRSDVVVNSQWAAGGSVSSLRAGLAACPSATDAAVVVPADTPGITVRTIDAVREAWDADQPWAAVTAYRDGLGHPLVLARRAFARLDALQGDKALWPLVVDGDGTRRVMVDTDRPTDVNTEADYLHVRRLASDGRL